MRLALPETSPLLAATEAHLHKKLPDRRPAILSRNLHSVASSFSHRVTVTPFSKPPCGFADWATFTIPALRTSQQCHRYQVDDLKQTCCESYIHSTACRSTALGKLTSFRSRTFHTTSYVQSTSTSGRGAFGTEYHALGSKTGVVIALLITLQNVRPCLRSRNTRSERTCVVPTRRNRNIRSTHHCVGSPWTS